MAIYIVRISDMQVEKILASHEQTIVSISWSVQDPSHLASCGADGWLFIWDVDKEKVISKKNLNSCPLQIEFAPLEEELVALVMDTGDIKVYDNGKDKLDKIIGLDGAKLVRWNHVAAGRLAIGTKLGGITLYNTKAKKSTKINISQDTAVEDLQWDPNSQNYLLACWRDGNLSLIDGDTGNEMQKFDKQGAGITCISWLKHVPGGFVTCNDKISALKIWSVSNKSPQHTIKAGEAPLLNIFNMFNTHYGKEGFLLTFKNGSVGVFNYNKKALEFMTQPNHSETIFDMAFKPNDRDILATGSFDGSIKIWEINQMKCIANLQKANPNINPSEPLSKAYKGQVVYSLAWAPGQTNQIISVNSKGQVMLWDTAKSKLLYEISPGAESPIFRADWSTLNPNMIAVGHADTHCYIVALNNNTLAVATKLKHPEGVYGVAWNPFNKNLVATACSDNQVRIWDYTANTIISRHLGHTARVFNLAWNPLIPNILASGSDDHTIRIWDVKQQTSRTLSGHTHFVRGLVWNTELPWLLSSGSWDSSIITWDARDEKIIHIANEHNADVYGIASHPERPFVYVSCSRDTSVRFWSVGKVVSALALRIIITNDWDDILAMPPVSFDAKGDLLKLCGNASKKVAGAASNVSSDAVDYYEKVLDFFSYMDYQKEFWDISKANLKNRTEDPTNRVVSLANLPSLYLSKAQELESKGSTSGFTYDALNKKSDRVMEAANMYLKLGEFELYCEALAKLGKWEKALAFAPAVSYEYWKSLSKRYAQELSSEGSEEVGSFYIASGQISEAIKFYIERGDFEDARLLSALKINNKFAYLEAPDRYQAKFKSNETLKINSESFNSPELREIIGNLAEDAMKANQPLLAAAYHLSILDGNSAALKLLRANEPLYAFALCKLYNLDIMSHVAMVLAHRADKVGERFLGNILLAQLPDKRPLEIFCANTPISNREANDLYAQNNLHDIEKYASLAQKAMEKGNVLEAVRCHILSKNTEKACFVAVDIATDALKKRQADRMAELPEIFDLLSYGQVNSLTNFQLKFQVIAFSLYFGLKKAMWKGISPIVPLIYKTFRNFIEDRGKQIDFPVNLEEVDLEVASYDALLKPDDAYSRIASLHKDLRSESYKTGASNMAKNIKEVMGNESKTTLKKQLERDLNKHKVFIPGANLPSQIKRADQPVSILSGRFIRSEVHILEDNRSMIAVDEALMWSECCKLSPLLTGCMINLT